MIISGILYKLYKAANHRNVRIVCCGKKFSASIDIGYNSPSPSSSQHQIIDVEESSRKRNESYYATKIQAAYRGYYSRRRLQFEELIRLARLANL